MKTNKSENTWVLVYDTEKNIIAKNPPNLHTSTSDDYQLVEFNSEEEMTQYIIDNKLVETHETNL